MRTLSKVFSQCPLTKAMNTDSFSRSLKLKIGGRDFHIACEDHERQNLLDAAQLLNTELTKNNVGGAGLVTLETGAVMVALNLAGELLKSDRSESRLEQQDSQLIGKLVDDLTEALI